ncbi:Non-specific serine/threonine protein kinase [Handroanthus impetiginosus]|uniref:Non-specific serine/threonine protein kinase n=1 Tax=Handroanthus impetiginosus TaxID=429701 RepID=A0A2G9GYY2_9LAMI|nr:Non-specific serine/threonine protein kinase [Handroanthus impetiginosus]
MAVEKFNLGRKNFVIVGIRFDGHAKELLDWALIKVAAPGDSVVAVHVCRHSGCISNEKALLDCYLKDSEELCNKKKVALSAEILKGDSFRKMLVKEAKKYSASAVIVGITKHTALGGWTSVARYCMKKLPPTTEVIAVYNGKVVFSRRSKQLEGHGKDRDLGFHLHDKFTLRDTHSEFGESEISDMSRFSCDGRSVTMSSNDEILSPLRGQKKGSLSSISLPVEDFTKQRPGWPLLQTASLRTRPSNEARKMSVVQWVMSLPHRSLSEVSESNSLTSTAEDSQERENETLTEMSSRIKIASEEKLQKDLELILMKNSARCKVFSHDVLKMSAAKFSSGNLIGKGGSNSVYKGILPGGKQVAVKILLSSKDSRKDFLREVDIMTTLKHKRIAPLFGICIKDNQLISVYEFLPKGNLEENLHGNRKGNSVLSWKVRFRIAVGIAEALNYIHNECSKPIIHRDVKSSNILLTHELEPQELLAILLLSILCMVKSATRSMYMLSA